MNEDIVAKPDPRSGTQWTPRNTKAVRVRRTTRERLLSSDDCSIANNILTDQLRQPIPTLPVNNLWLATISPCGKRLPELLKATCYRIR